MNVIWGVVAVSSLVIAAILVLWFIRVVRASRPAADHTGNDRLLYAYSLLGYSCTNLLIRLLVLVSLSALGAFSLFCALQ